MSDQKHKYEGDNADVYWDGRLCIHVGECGRADGDLFMGGREPWCQPSLVALDNVMDVVARCPSGALTVDAKDGSQLKNPEENRVTVANNGPLYFEGELQIDGAADDMDGVKMRAALCRCGQSKNKPFCDNSHEEAGFVDRGAIGRAGEALESKGGPLEVKRLQDGPLMVNGNLQLVASSGRVAWEGTRAALCRCGESKNKPFCDGSHKPAGFKAD